MKDRFTVMPISDLKGNTISYLVMDAQTSNVFSAFPVTYKMDRHEAHRRAVLAAMHFNQHPPLYWDGMPHKVTIKKGSGPVLRHTADMEALDIPEDDGSRYFLIPMKSRRSKNFAITVKDRHTGIVIKTIHALLDISPQQAVDEAVQLCAELNGKK